MVADARQTKTEVFEQFALIGKALSSARRLELLDLLCQAERTVEVLAGESSQSVANTSQHLQVLRRAGLVTTRRQGNFVVYQIAADDVCRLWRVVQEVGGKQVAEIEATVAKYFEKKHELEVITPGEILRRTRTGEILLLDVRPEEEFRYSHVAGARSIPLRDIEKRLCELPRDKTIVAYCRGPYCVLSEEAVKVLRLKGFTAYRIAEGVRGFERQA